jgi:hypothetical protein
MPIKVEASSAPQSVWTCWRREKSLSHTGLRTPDRPGRTPVATTITLSRLTKLNFLYYGLFGRDAESFCRSSRFGEARHLLIASRPNHEGGSSIYLRNGAIHLQYDNIPQPRTPQNTPSTLWKPDDLYCILIHYIRAAISE